MMSFIQFLQEKNESKKKEKKDNIKTTPEWPTKTSLNTAGVAATWPGGVT